jgi:hypothetical protein
LFAYTNVCSFTAKGRIDAKIPLEKSFTEPFDAKLPLPERMEGNDLFKFSKVFEQTATCVRYDFKRYNKTAGEIIEIVWDQPATDKQASLTGRFRERIGTRDAVQGTNIDSIKY